MILPPESLRMPSPVETGGLADIEGSYHPPHSPALLHQWCAPDPAQFQVFAIVLLTPLMCDLRNIIPIPNERARLISTRKKLPWDQIQGVDHHIPYPDGIAIHVRSPRRGHLTSHTRARNPTEKSLP
jgi:hypothetical protein